MLTHTADRSVRDMAHRAWPFAVASTPAAIAAHAANAAALESVGRSTI